MSQGLVRGDQGSGSVQWKPLSPKRKYERQTSSGYKVGVRDVCHSQSKFFHFDVDFGTNFSKGRL